MMEDHKGVILQEENYSIKELNRQFSPNIWNPKKDKLDIIVDHYRLSLEGTEQVRQEIPCSLDHKYGEKTAQKFDIYGTDLSESALTFVWIHGGGWQAGTKDISGYFSHILRKWGIRTIVLGYTLAPIATVTEMVEEIKSCVKTVMKLYPNSDLVLGGHSAGAHLASCILHDNDTSFDTSQIKKIVLFSGVYDLRPFARTMFNQNTKITGEEAARLSSVLQRTVNSRLKAQKIQVLIIVGHCDPPIFKSQAEKYQQNLFSLGVTSRCWISLQDDHFSIVENLRAEESGVTLQLRQFLTNCDSTFTLSRL